MVTTKYRIVERADGTFSAYYKRFLFWRPIYDNHYPSREMARAAMRDWAKRQNADQIIDFEDITLEELLG